MKINRDELVEYEQGEVFDYEGESVVCVRRDSKKCCMHCVFEEEPCCNFACMSFDREDDTDVYFTKVKESEQQ